MNFKMSYFKFTQKQIRFMSSTKKKSHYDSLGIPSTSTQGEVKSAYYKLSMMYHPDKNQSAESSQKFRDITEAYEILGNTKTRRLYDKGLYFGGAATSADDTVNKFHKSRETRSRPPPPTGRTPIYDFDEWSRSHYGTTFHRQMNHRRKMQMSKMKHEEHINTIKIEKILFMFGILIAISMYFVRESTDYDKAPTYDYSLGIRLSKPNSKD